MSRYVYDYGGYWRWSYAKGVVESEMDGIIDTLLDSVRPRRVSPSSILGEKRRGDGRVIRLRVSTGSSLKQLARGAIALPTASRAQYYQKARVDVCTGEE